MASVQLTDSERDSVKGAVKHAKLIEKSRQLARVVRTEHPSPESLARRATLEPRLADWLM